MFLFFGNKFYTTDDMCCGVYFFWVGFYIKYVTPVILIPIIIPQCFHGKYYIELNTSRSFIFHMHYFGIYFFHFFLGKWVGITTAPYLLYEKWQCPLGWWILIEVRESLLWYRWYRCFALQSRWNWGFECNFKIF